ncbi:type VII secretion target [Nocardia arthritidis]|uniref:ESX-1 secretion-associated protein n=1 Tax=Nocardia arthritidis TaxID=228602 RepID=A0A6G9Y7G1_9NOCA|nr:hypothetical protein F5544_06420 [Nocardia arthritidis]
MCRVGGHMDDFMAAPAKVAGFGTDLKSIADHFWSSASSITGAISLPNQATGLLSTLATSFQIFHENITAAHQQNRNKLDSLGQELGNASQRYQNQDQQYADALAAATSGISPDAVSAVARQRRLARFASADCNSPACRRFRMTSSRCGVSWRPGSD